MTIDTEPHDVFISYARENAAWVQQHLYERLRACRTAAGRPPRIFFDQGEDGILIGQDFQTAIDRAIEKTRKFVPVYSSLYFQKKMCIYEFELARSRDVTFQDRLLLPILIEQKAAELVPFALRRLNFLPITDGDWFKKLCQSLDLTLSSEQLSLAFEAQPGDVFANHTLPVIRVAVRSPAGPIAYQDEITLRAERGQLLGTTTVKTQQGFATFEDLSIANAVEATRLIASSPSLGEVCSQPFTVFTLPAVNEIHRKPTIAPPLDLPLTPMVVAPRRASRPTISGTGELVFFATGRHFVLIQPSRVGIYSVDGALVANVALELRGPLRLIRRRDGRIVLADWQGNVQLLHDDGRHSVWRFGEHSSGFVIPADIDLIDNDIYVGFWSGSVFRLRTSGEAELLHRDAEGIQALGACGDRLFTCDFAGNLRVYRQQQLINTVTVEPTVWLLKDTPTSMVAVGEHKYYHIAHNGSKVFADEMQLSGVSSVYELSDLPVVVDAHGKGIRFDANLVITATVYTQPGAEPVSADDLGRYCVFQNPDRTRSLLVGERIVFSQSGGSLAVSPQGDRFALGDGMKIELYSEAEFLEVIGRQDGVSAGGEA